MLSVGILGDGSICRLSRAEEEQTNRFAHLLSIVVTY